MSDPFGLNACLNLVEMTIDSMYELEAIGELLEQRGVMAKSEIIALAREMKRKSPPYESRTATTNDVTANGKEDLLQTPLFVFEFAVT